MKSVININILENLKPKRTFKQISKYYISNSNP